MATDHSFRHVYVVWDYKTQLAKIGHSKNPGPRLSALRKQYGCHLEMIWKKYCRRGTSVEELAHGILLAHRVHGEWFSVTPEAAIAAAEDANRLTERHSAEYDAWHRSGCVGKQPTWPSMAFHRELGEWHGRRCRAGREAAKQRRAETKIEAPPG